MLTRMRCPSQSTSLMYTMWTVSCSFLLSRTFKKVCPSQEIVFSFDPTRPFFVYFAKKSRKKVSLNKFLFETKGEVYFLLTGVRKKVEKIRRKKKESILSHDSIVTQCTLLHPHGAIAIIECVRVAKHSLRYFSVSFGVPGLSCTEPPGVLLQLGGVGLRWSSASLCPIVNALLFHSVTNVGLKSLSAQSLMLNST